MSYLFKKRSRRIIKKAESVADESNPELNTGSKFLSQQGKLKQTAVANSFQEPKKLRRVQLRGWK
jgi:hypothetical protein